MSEVSLPTIRTGKVLALLGLPVCSTLVVAFPMFGVLSVVEGPPLERRDWVAGAVFVVVALVALVVALRSSARVWRRGAQSADLSPWVARAVPALVVIGAVLGVLFARSVRAAQHQNLEQTVRFLWCDAPELLGQADAEACVEAGLDCQRAAWTDPAPFQARADALQTRLEARRKAAMAAADYDDAAVRAIDRLLSELRFDEARPVTSAADRGALACLAAGTDE